MWIFAKEGLLMPSAIPFDKVDQTYIKPGYDLQVRGRVREHLERWAEKYMPEGSYSAIQETPGMDYNVRFYCSHDDFAWAMGRAIADIDYRKFKPEAERKEFGQIGKDYHSVLNAIWGTVTRLGDPGGWWGAYDKVKNPSGYKPGEYTKRYPETVKSAGSSSYTSLKDYDWAEAYDTETDSDRRLYGYGYDSDSDEAEAIMQDLRGAGIPVSEWLDSCTEREYALIRDYVPAERRAEKARQRRARRSSKRRHGKAA